MLIKIILEIILAFLDDIISYLKRLYNSLSEKKKAMLVKAIAIIVIVALKEVL